MIPIAQQRRGEDNQGLALPFICLRGEENPKSENYLGPSSQLTVREFVSNALGRLLELVLNILEEERDSFILFCRQRHSAESSKLLTTSASTRARPGEACLPSQHRGDHGRRKSSRPEWATQRDPVSRKCGWEDGPVGKSTCYTRMRIQFRIPRAQAKSQVLPHMSVTQHWGTETEWLALFDYQHNSRFSE